MLTKRTTKKKKAQGFVAKKLTMFRIQVRSRHPSHNWLRSNIGLVPFRSVVRLGSTSDLPDTVTNGGKRIECNTIKSIKISANKKLMKEAFAKAKVKTADWISSTDNSAIISWSRDRYPIVAKHIYGSRGEGNFLLKDQRELENWLRGKTLSNYIFEKFYNYNREYRLHVTKEGCFYTCRKMLREDTPKDKRWFRNDSNCTWYLETNEGFDKPNNWPSIVDECIKALNATGLDIGGFDVKVQSTKDKKGRNREGVDFIVIESNSACSHGEETRQKYLEVIPRVLRTKYDELNTHR